MGDMCLNVGSPVDWAAQGSREEGSGLARHASSSISPLSSRISAIEHTAALGLAS